jgi:hypothetical protein
MADEDILGNRSTARHGARMNNTDVVPARDTTSTAKRR